jgi:outer membrane immunogenic protein
VKKLALSVVGIVVLIGKPAFAADMAVTAVPATPLPPPAPVYGWTGWYLGGNVGYGWGNATTNLSGTGNVSLVSIGTTSFPSNFAFANSDSAQPNGVIGGGQIGYNFQQYGLNWVLGLEADIQGSAQRWSNSFVDAFSTPICTSASGPPAVCTETGTFNGTAVTNYDAKLDWFGTVRARLGYLLTPQLLLYGTGGLAYGNVEVSGNTAVSGSKAVGTSAISASKTNVGFSAGGGIEGSVWLPINWTWKLEYLYLDFGSFDTTTSFAGGLGSGAITTHIHFKDNLFRGGLNYRFY